MPVHTIRLKTIHCVKAAADRGSPRNECSLMIQADAGAVLRLPFDPLQSRSMGPGDDWHLKTSAGDWIEAKFTQDLQLMLWEDDNKWLTDDTDFLGATCIFPSSTSGTMKLTNGNDSDYRLSWEWA